MNRGKRRKAREGKLVAGPRPGYGFRFDKDKVYETMHRRVFVHPDDYGRGTLPPLPPPLPVVK